jgi:hypothetical protein
MYMNWCALYGIFRNRSSFEKKHSATITINGGGQSTLDSYPDIFKCHIGNGCTIPEGTDVVFQNPGASLNITG